MNSVRTVVELLVAYAVGFGLMAGLWRGCRPTFSNAVFERLNYRHHRLPTAVGVLISIVLVTVVGAQTLAADVLRRLFGPSVNGWDHLSTIGSTAAALALGFSLLGLLDDIGGVGESGGFRGHVSALFDGRITTGLIKMVCGPVVAVTVLAGAEAGLTRAGLLRDAALICLAANLANLFDRAPGRTNKVAQFGFVALVAATTAPILAPIAVAVGAAGGLLAGDLREELMLGDAGSNALGAVIGLGIVSTTSETVRLAGVGVLALANLASEFVSFTKIIDGIAPLRRLDRLGAPHRPR